MEQRAGRGLHQQVETVETADVRTGRDRAAETTIPGDGTLRDGWKTMGRRRLILIPQRPGSIESEGKRVGKPRSRFRSAPKLRESHFRSGRCVPFYSGDDTSEIHLLTDAKDNDYVNQF